MNGTVRRSGYLEQMHGSKGATGVIKVITGMRRCGKSTLMEQFEEDLRSEGVDSNHIFHVNFETFEGYDILSPDELRRQLRALPKDGIVYVMLDEIQDVEGWELIVSSLEEVKNYDVYITGSNSDMLSTDLSTHLSGRYIEIKMLPLSFGEYYELHPGNAEDRFVQYLRYGGLPDTDPEIALRIYYAQAGEELFAVARRFHVAPAQILAANQLEEELTSLPQAQRLLIPVT